MITLDIGMALYADTGNQKLVVTRVTAKRAFCENTRCSVEETEFDREQSRDGFKPRGSAGSWSTPFFYLETEERMTVYNRYLLICKFNRIEAADLATNQIQRILEIAKEGKE